MAFEGLKEKFKDSWSDLSSKVQENATFNNIREKFEEQSARNQRLIVAGLFLIIGLFLMSFPFGYISESNDTMTSFEENRSLIQGLLHASRAAKEPSPLPTPSPPEMLKSRVEAILKENRLVVDQMGEMQFMPDHPAKDLAPAAVIQSGLAVQIKKINVEQIMLLGHQLQNMGPGIKLMGFDVVQSPGQTHYYDMIVRVVSFALPQMTLDADVPSKGGKKGSTRRGQPKKTDEETGE